MQPVVQTIWAQAPQAMKALLRRAVSRKLFQPQPLSPQRRFILVSGTAALLAACTKSRQAQNASRPPSSSSSVAASSVKIIQHALGEIAVPMDPSRVVVYGYAIVDAVLSLGVEPIGVPSTILNEMVYLNLEREAIADIGEAGQPNLETLSALQPDLILTPQQIGESSYPLLSQIAPTVVLAVDERADWREATRLCAEALDKQTEAKTLSADYENKLAQLKARVSQNLGEVETSIVYIRPGEIRTMGQDSFPGSVLSDAGLSRPPAQAQGPDRRNLSLESLDQIDGDVMFILTPQSSSEQAAGVKAEIERVKATPLWSQLQAVKNNQVYEVAPYWALGNYSAANRMIDDLMRYFTEIS